MNQIILKLHSTGSIVSYAIYEKSALGNLKSLDDLTNPDAVLDNIPTFYDHCKYLLEAPSLDQNEDNRIEIITNGQSISFPIDEYFGKQQGKKNNSNLKFPELAKKSQKIVFEINTGDCVFGSNFEIDSEFDLSKLKFDLGHLDFPTNSLSVEKISFLFLKFEYDGKTYYLEEWENFGRNSALGEIE